MPVSIVVGGQFGSEGKGKISLEIAKRSKTPVTMVRVGGPNSGHTAYDKFGKMWALRQMPAGCVDLDVDVVFSAGSYLDVDLLLSEIMELGFPEERIRVSKYARVITTDHKIWEREGGLVGAIGSTGSGVGGAVMASAAREAANFPLKSVMAEDIEPLQRFLCDSSEELRRRLETGQRVVVEGTQGFGLSLLDGGHWPKATARTTTAAGALAEAGLSPMDVDDVTLVLRSYPIRVAGDSGPLPNEITWDEVARRGGRHDDLREFTTVTKKLRRVGEFDAALVKRALHANKPSRLVLNHLDYLGDQSSLGTEGSQVQSFVAHTSKVLERKIDWFGFGPLGVVEAREAV